MPNRPPKPREENEKMETITDALAVIAARVKDAGVAERAALKLQMDLLKAIDRTLPKLTIPAVGE